MNEPIEQTASFSLNDISVTVNTSPAGRSFTVDGTIYTTQQIFSWQPGSNHTLLTTSPQNGTTGTRYVWSNWSDGGNISHTISPTVNTTYTANFNTEYYLTMTAETGGTVTPSSGWRGEGESVQIEAFADAGYSFAGWTGTGSGSYTGNNNPATVTMNGPIEQTVSFSLNDISVTVNTSPAGRSFTVDGTIYATQQVFSWQPGSSHTIATVSPQSGTTGTRYVWSNWSDGGNISHTISPTVNTTYTANFDTEYYLTMTSGTGGSVTPSSGWRGEGESVQIEAFADAGYSFAGWTGTGSGSYTGNSNPVQITMNGPIEQTASFSLNDISVTVNTSPAGRSFTVDGTIYTTQQIFSWQPGSNHTLLTTSPQNGTTGTRYVWSNWSDGGNISHTISPTVNTTYTANFNTEYYLTMTAETGGSVTPSSGWRGEGESVQIEALADAGYSFAGWTGTGSGSYTGNSNPVQITMNEPIEQTASFSLNDISVTVNTSPAGRSFTVDGTIYTTQQIFSWQPGSNHTLLTTSPQNGTTGTRYVWSNWSDGGNISHTISPTVNTTYTANFDTEYYLTMTAETGGTVTPSSGWRGEGESVQIEAFADAGYSFAGWTGTGSGSYTGNNNPATVTMNGPIEQTVSFSLNDISVTVNTSPAGRSFTVDGTTYTTQQVFSWQPGSSHTLLTTSPQSGGTGTQYLWTNWSDGGNISHTVSPTVNSTYTANFDTEYYLTMTSGTGGSVTPSSGWRGEGESVQIEALADAGYNFAGWTGTGSGSYTGNNNPVTITINGPISEAAYFELIAIEIPLDPIPPLEAFPGGIITVKIDLGSTSIPVSDLQIISLNFYIQTHHHQP